MLTVTIAGVDRTANVRFDTLSKNDNINSDEDTLDFEFEGTYAQRPQASQEIIVLDGADKIFGGYIIRPEEMETVPGRLSWQVSATDYQRHADKHLVTESYDNKTLKYMVQDIATKYCPGFTTTNVETGPTFVKKQFDYDYPTACFEDLARLAQMHWYIDYNKDIHFFQKETNVAPFVITEGNGKYDDLTVSPDVTRLKNSIIVRGGTYVSDAFADRLPTDGTSRVLPSRYKIRELVSATLNGVAKTVFGVEYIDDKTAKEILVNYNEQHILVGDLIASVPLLSDNLTLNYKYDVPVLIQKEDAVSIASMAALEGGDGIYEFVIVDKSINSKEVAKQRADAELKEFANPIVRISFTTNEKGLRSGQLININLPARGVNGNYLIRSVTTTVETPSASLLKYRVETESKLKGIDDLLIELFALSKRTDEIRENEVLEKLKGFTDSLSVTDALTVSSAVPVKTVGTARVGYSEVG